MSPSPGNMFLEKGEKTIGSRYKKVVYREYTNDSFSVQKKRQPSQQHLGIMGKLSCSLCRFFNKNEGDTGFLFPCRSDNQSRGRRADRDHIQEQSQPAILDQRTRS